MPREPELQRVEYASRTTGGPRRFLVYLPADVAAGAKEPRPLLFFLHGTGERGDGLGDLDYVLRFGPLREAWLGLRDLPFIMVSPQLPVFEMHHHAAFHEGVVIPPRRPGQPAGTVSEDRPGRRMTRKAPRTPGLKEIDGETAAQGGPPGGWQDYGEDLEAILGLVCDRWPVDRSRRYLTGISYGGFGTWWWAARRPERWAAIAPICGDADPAWADRFVDPERPVWAFHGGRDTVIHVDWALRMVNALEQAGHRSVRMTVHEDLGHNCWDRVYGGEDLYRWFLSHRMEGATRA